MTSYLRKKFQNLTTTSQSSESEDVVRETEVNPGNNMEEIERSKIGIVRALVQNQNPSAKDLDDIMIRRFLRARDHDVEKASAMLLKYLKWRTEFVTTGFISPSEITTDIAHGKLFMQGFDKTGRPIVVVFAARHKATNVEDFKRYVTYSLDKICASDIRGYIAALSILQDYYPERLGKFFIINVPYIFMTAWKMVYPFIDKNTRKKILFVESSKTWSTLLQDIDESQLPDSFGGKLELVPIQDC
ncbi:Sec14p-like phosphatidylinositol transfer family protein [Striga asiatica]|uniref:Sec14p-like phosphatidylinositol transfer family protein n=1 Tax=Striga asiatica TaxID=4170 RepID=A0A5A7R9L4_STRAF|nr:Sec14p-like phosphatidylinositol transfer family protein [Striga asiatica]